MCIRDSDNCDTDVTITFNGTRTDGDCPNNYTLTRTWTATDDCGNTTSATQIVKVQDTQAPLWTTTQGSLDATYSCGDVIAPITPPVAVDDSGIQDIIEFSNQVTTGACANTFTRVMTWRATDACGNVSTTDFTATITVTDETKPDWGTFNWNSNVSCDALSIDIPTATDNCDTDVNVFQLEEDVIVAGACPNAYTITRRWRAEDDCGNRRTRTQTINVQDTSRPTWDEFDWVSRVDCDSIPLHTGAGAMRPSGTDNCASDVRVDFLGETTEAVTCTNQYTLKRNWQIVDVCGNSRTRTQTINVKDNTKPDWNEFDWVSRVECDSIPLHTGAGAMRPSGTDNCASDVRVDFLGETTEAGTCLSLIHI